MARAAFVYLHGFASGPSSSKAKVFAGRFREAGVPLDVPDLNEPGGFEGLTVTRMLEVVASRVARHGKTVLIGSSLGGYTAALMAARAPSVEAICIMAPAFDFPARLRDRIEREDPSVKEKGSFEVFHFAQKASARIGYEIVTDGLRYEPFPDVKCPALVFHGVKDESVPVELSRRFCAGRSSARLIELDDDHQLIASTGAIWAEMRPFLAPWM